MDASGIGGARPAGEEATCWRGSGATSRGLRRVRQPPRRPHLRLRQASLRRVRGRSRCAAGNAPPSVSIPQGAEAPRGASVVAVPGRANACFMKRRKGKFEPEREISIEALMPGPGQTGGAEIPDPRPCRRGVRAIGDPGQGPAAIGDLPPHYRIVLVMRDMEHLSTREVSDASAFRRPRSRCASTGLV